MIIIRLDRILADRKMTSKELSGLVGITKSNISIIKKGKIKAMRMDTLNSICKHLNCQPKDILEYMPDFED
jgi:putative transcriptional regulator